METDLRFLIVDDDALVRQAVQKVLKNNFPNSSVTESASLEDALTKLDAEKWSLIVLDLALGKKSGTTVIKQARAQKLSIPILVLSSQKENEVALPVLKVGANGYLLKDDAVTTDRLATAVKVLLEGGKYISQELTKRLIEESSTATTEDQNELSPQEARVLFFIARGNPVKQVAELMGVSEKTVRTYRARLLEKLGLKSDGDIIRYAIEQGIID